MPSTAPTAVASLIPVLTAIVAAAAVLLSQYMNSRTALKSKRLEIILSKKVEAYAAYLAETGRFVHSSQGKDYAPEELYRPYMDATNLVRIFASRSVHDALLGKDGVDVLVQSMRAADRPSRVNVIPPEIVRRVDRLAIAMREDLQSDSA